MAIAAAQGLAYTTHFTSFHRPLIFCVQTIRNSTSISSALESLVEPQTIPIDKTIRLSTTSYGEKDYSKVSEWKKLNSEELGIRTSMIAKPTRVVLNGLRKKGYSVYLVGGCVRDLILQKTPKDFDVITSAELKEVHRTFYRCEIVGRRFPICHVYIDDTLIEVSSFSTSAKKFGRYTHNSIRKPTNCSNADFTRWKNCMQRDFTINGLMFDPFEKIVYDYTGGLEDIRRAKVRSVIPAATSFNEDCARILRGVRIAARLRFRFAKETAHFVRELSDSVLRLDKGRILMEMNYMLAYGSAEASLRLMWKFGLLEILLPIHAAYFVSQGFRRRDKRSNMLLTLFSNLDKLVAPDRPCHSSLWVSILAFHKAIADRPRDPLVIAAFSITVHTGGSLDDAIKIVRKMSQPHDPQFNELSAVRFVGSDEKLMDEVINLGVSVKVALRKMTDEFFVSQALIEYPQAPHSDLVFISFGLSEKVNGVFDCVKRGKNGGFIGKNRGNIDYEALALGRQHEIRHLFGRIVFDTVYPPSLSEQGYNFVN